MMKKLWILFLLFFLLSCEKDDTHCYRCETTAGEFTSTVTSECEMTFDEMEKLRDGLRIQASLMTGVPAITICEETECITNNY